MAPFPSSSLSSFNPKEGGVAPSGGVKNLILFKIKLFNLFSSISKLFNSRSTKTISTYYSDHIYKNKYVDSFLKNMEEKMYFFKIWGSKSKSCVYQKTIL